MKQEPSAKSPIPIFERDDSTLSPYHRVILRVGTLVQFASEQSRRSIAEPEIRFDLSGSSAGQCCRERGRFCLRFHSQLLNQYPDRFLKQTVPHEVAHLVAISLSGSKIRPHGEEWQHWMRLFGAEPRRCHDFDLSGIKRHQQRRFPYRCACNTHQLTTTRHNRIQKGVSYICKRCGEPLSPLNP